MRITFVVLLCSIAAAIASPAGERFLDKLVDETMDQDLYESDAKQGQANAALKSFKDDLAHFMQRCARASRDCHVPPDEAICGSDDRQIILDPNVNPNRWICRIVMTSSTGSLTTGSAFKVKISPDVGRTVLFTAAHALRDDRTGGYVSRVQIQCPDEPEVTVRRNNNRDMWIAQQYLNAQDWDYDYGYITYPGNSNTGFGFQGFIDGEELRRDRTRLHACGFPTEQDNCISQCELPASPPAAPLQYCDSGLVTDSNKDKVYVDADVDSGESGGPLYDSTGNNFIAYGIISLGSDACPEGRNYQRLTAEAIYEMLSNIGGVDMTFRLRGSEDVYLNMDGSGLDGTAGNILGGEVYAGFRDDTHGTFAIFPIKQSSSNQPDSQLVAIRSANQDNIYLSLDGSGVTQYLLRGGGMAQCRYGIDDGAMETFHKEVEPDGQFAFRSTTFNNVYLRVDHWHVKKPGDKGEVNAQFGKYTLETNWPEEVRVINFNYAERRERMRPGRRYRPGRRRRVRPGRRYRPIDRTDSSRSGSSSSSSKMAYESDIKQSLFDESFKDYLARFKQTHMERAR